MQLLTLMTEKYAIIVAGGVGNRAGGSVPKQFRNLCGIPMLWWSVRAFHQENPETKIILVLNSAYVGLWNELYESLPSEDRSIAVTVTSGGDSRLESVWNGLKCVPDSGGSLVAVHDAARPLITTDIIRRGWEAASQSGAAVPVAPLVDSIRHISDAGNFSVPRKEYVRVQTPQVFDSESLKRAYDRPFSPDLTDDASVVEAAGYKITLFDGSDYNLKVTAPNDFAIAETLLNQFQASPS